MNSKDVVTPLGTLPGNTAEAWSTPPIEVSCQPLCSASQGAPLPPYPRPLQALGLPGLGGQVWPKKWDVPQLSLLPSPGWIPTPSSVLLGKARSLVCSGSGVWGPEWTAMPPEGTGPPPPPARDAIDSCHSGLFSEECCGGWRRSQTAAEGVGRPPWLPGPD